MAGIRVNKADLAHIFGVDQPTIEDWMRLGLPYMRRRRSGVGADGFEREVVFDTADAINWRLTSAETSDEW